LTSFSILSLQSTSSGHLTLRHHRHYDVGY
jgi:hypothetical protein